MAAFGAGSPALPYGWLTELNHGISPAHAHLRITRAAFGRSVNPHSFHDAMATTVAIDCPRADRHRDAAALPWRPGTAQRHYTLARAMEASTTWPETL